LSLSKQLLIDLGADIQAIKSRSLSRSDGMGGNMNGATFYNRNGTPSTPQTSNVGIATGQSQAHTPHLTPSGGRFGQFQYARA
jgi:hypothetical protein